MVRSNKHFKLDISPCRAFLCYTKSEMKKECYKVYKIGEKYKNKMDLWAEIINRERLRNGQLSKYVTIRFLDSNYECDVHISNLKRGAFKDYGRPTVYGAGYSSPGLNTEYPQEYKTWSHMIKRCYEEKSDAYPWYGGKGVEVCDRWLHLENFIKDLPKLKNYKKYKNGFGEGLINEYTLDKDILGSGMIYSPNNCMFASKIEQRHAQHPDRMHKVKSISPEGKTEVFDTISDACNQLGVQNANVYKVLNGQRKHTKGYKFLSLR